MFTPQVTIKDVTGEKQTLHHFWKVNIFLEWWVQDEDIHLRNWVRMSRTCGKKLNLRLFAKRFVGYEAKMLSVTVLFELI